MKNSIIKMSLVNALGVTLYVASVTLVMRNAEKVFGKMDSYVGQLSFLMLFVLSAAVVGYLILGKPIMLYLDNAKKEAIQVLTYTIGILFLATIIALAIQVWL